MHMHKCMQQQFTNDRGYEFEKDLKVCFARNKGKGKLC